MLITVFSLCALLGAIVGVLAGLLGIGGGLVIVPALVYLLPQLGVEASLVMPMALATSLGTIVVTSSSAMLAHHKNANIPWDIAKPLIIVVALGSFSGAFIADILSTEALQNFFATAVLVLASYMLFALRSERSRPMPSIYVLQLASFIVGVIASLMGMAGGAILVPVLTYFGVSLRHSIGIATVCGIAVALAGATGYIYTGLDKADLPSWSIGYVYLPALLGIVLTSSVFAPLGVKLAAKLPVKSLKKVFALFLILVAIEMMYN
ncbi:MAG: sulfite exporter TauE/SafE family protein [Colwellia sp.]